MSVVFQPALLDVVWNVAPDQIPTDAVPCRAFRPEGVFTVIDSLDRGVAEFEFVEALIERNQARIGVTDRRSVLIKIVGAEQLCGRERRGSRRQKGTSSDIGMGWVSCRSVGFLGDE